ncbi:uncharacterized protein Dmoj_GI14097, isoform B [Drosophila mojavensis]|nr:uncharacterized protein Dmoj_GI14097, isoform B [Drosophila mojavensis]
MVTNDVFETNAILANHIHDRSQRKRMRTVINELNENRFDSPSMAYIIGTTNRSSSKSKNKTKYHHLRSVSSGTEGERDKTIHGSDTRTRIGNRNSLDWNKNTKSKAYSESTYLIDINRSRDSDSTKNDVSGGAAADFGHDDHIYFNDYRVQIQNKDHKQKQKPSGSNNARVKKKQSRGGHDVITMHDQDNVNGFEREDYFGSTQEIITFAEEGAQFQQYRIVEFAAQKAGIPNQKIYIRSAQMHVRIERQDVKSEAVNRDAQPTMHTTRKSHANGPRQRIKIWVFRMSDGINMTEKQAMDQAFLFRALFEVDTERLGWQKFDLTETIREWYSDTSGENLRLLIDCTGCGSKYSLQLFQLSGPVKSASDRYLNPNRPFLVLHTESPRPRRVRRRAIDCGGALSGQCCKESFYVSFKALGWDDWIIAPRGYFANYCRGECTGSFRTPDTFQTFHAHFIEEYRKMGLLNGMRPCCAPIKFSSMSLIYYGDDGIIKRDLPKMVVDECGCP